MANKSYILSNPGILLIKTEGGSYVPVGFTRGGITITPAKDIREIEADQSDYPLYYKTSRKSATIEFRLLEVTPENLKMAWGEPGKSGDSSGTVTLGVPESIPMVYSIKVYAQRMDGQYVIFEFTSCISTGAGAFTYSKTDEGVLEGRFQTTFDENLGGIGTFNVSSST
ncbi:MAG TPA: hypothetical protein PKV21_03465 [bacterium]|nr:hypothetical protein [bacterium]